MTGQLLLLTPLRHNRVYDLVREAGVDVGPWATSKRGARGAAANPKYCYEWAFVDGKIIVLNLWHQNLLERRGTVLSDFNVRTRIRQHYSPIGATLWKKRALRFDDAVAAAFSQDLAVRAIINAGDMKGPEERTRSKVDLRHLDPMPWRVQAYDAKSGATRLVRGGNTEYVDQFSEEARAEGLEGAVERVRFESERFERSPVVRALALARAGGRCEFCGEPGFLMMSGKLFLETHHIVPLSENGPDTVANVAAICPNHHREAHHGSSAGHIRLVLQARVAR